MTTWHNGNKFTVQFAGSHATVGIGTFTVDKAHEIIGAIREATGAPATAFSLLRTATV